MGEHVVLALKPFRTLDTIVSTETWQIFGVLGLFVLRQVLRRVDIRSNLIVASADVTS